MSEVPNIDEMTDEQRKEYKRTLMGRCDLMGIVYSNNATIETLLGKIEAKMNGTDTTLGGVDGDGLTSSGGVNALTGEDPADTRTEREKLIAESMKLIRVRVSNMNPNKADLPGEIVCVANEFIGTVRKFIPFGEATNDGYHIPQVLFDHLKEKKFLQIRTKVKGRTSDQVETGWVPEYSLEVLPQLTRAELDNLAKAQTAAGSVDTSIATA